MNKENQQLVLEKPENIFTTQEKDIPQQAKAICEIKNRPVVEYMLSMLFLLALLLILKKYYLWIYGIMLLISLIFVSAKKDLIAKIYENFIVLYWYDRNNHYQLLKINNEDLITWEIREKQVLEIYFRNSKKEVKGVRLPINNIQQTESKMNKYYYSKNSVRQRINSFVEKVKNNDGKTLYQKLRDKLKQKRK
ncbi:MAG: hypothetical protein Q4C64_05760 [Erysipelotrichia bacterium]|nr:hypothetical protein [Erysipelotrichia bacterium]